LHLTCAPSTFSPSCCALTPFQVQWSGRLCHCPCPRRQRPQPPVAVQQCELRLEWLVLRCARSAARSRAHAAAAHNQRQTRARTAGNNLAACPAPYHRPVFPAIYVPVQSCVVRAWVSDVLLLEIYKPDVNLGVNSSTFVGEGRAHLLFVQCGLWFTSRMHQALLSTLALPLARRCRCCTRCRAGAFSAMYLTYLTHH
jgi:hypothetical protein